MTTPDPVPQGTAYRDLPSLDHLLADGRVASLIAEHGAPPAMRYYSTAAEVMR